MGRRPIIIPRHQTSRSSSSSHGQLSVCDMSGLAHPLAFHETEQQQQQQQQHCKAIGIRRHGQPPPPVSKSGLYPSSDTTVAATTPPKQQQQHHRIPNTKIKRKKSPKSVAWLPLDFIREEEADDCEKDPEETSSKLDSAPREKQDDSNPAPREKDDDDDSDDDFFAKFNNDDDDDKLSDVFGSSVFSEIEHVNESDDLGDDCHVLCPSKDDDDDELEDRLGSMLTTSAGSSIRSTSTLERSTEQKNPHAFHNMPPFQAILERAISNKQNKGTACIATTTNTASSSVPSLSTPTPSMDHTECLQNRLLNNPTLPEDQRRVALLKYRFQQRNHNQSRRLLRASNNKHSKTAPTAAAAANQSSFNNNNYPEDSSPFRVTYQKKKSNNDDSSLWMDYWNLRTAATEAPSSSSRLSSSTTPSEQQQLEKANALVESLEAQLKAAKEHRDALLQRERELRFEQETKVQQLHRDILATTSGQHEYESCRRMLLRERIISDDDDGTTSGGEEEESSSLSNNNTSLLLQHDTSSSTASSAKLESIRRKLDDESTAMNINSNINKGSPSRRRRRRNEHRSLEELKVVQRRLEMIRDLMDQASKNTDETSRKVMMVNATSKYILFRNRNLV